MRSKRFALNRQIGFAEIYFQPGFAIGFASSALMKGRFNNVKAEGSL